MAHVRQKLRLASVREIGLFFRAEKIRFGPSAFGDIVHCAFEVDDVADGIAHRMAGHVNPNVASVGCANLRFVAFCFASSSRANQSRRT
jgi:hypothetical protein